MNGGLYSRTKLAALTQQFCGGGLASKVDGGLGLTGEVEGTGGVVVVLGVRDEGRPSLSLPISWP